MIYCLLLFLNLLLNSHFEALEDFLIKNPPLKGIMEDQEEYYSSLE
jgi:hypothetical protein